MYKAIILSVLVLIWIFAVCQTQARNIDPYQDDSKYAYSENVGWFNFDPNTGPGVLVTKDKIIGFIWAENIGWINLSPASYGGISNDGNGNLYGYAWGENIGWINFNPTNGGVIIDSEGNFDGWAWGENIGWIHLASTLPVSYGVQACVVMLDDLQNFASYWLTNEPAADLYSNGTVNMPDYSIFAAYWQDFCPNGWQLQ